MMKIKWKKESSEKLIGKIAKKKENINEKQNVLIFRNK